MFDALRDALGRLDVVSAWAEATAREVRQHPFQRDVAFLRRLLP